MIPLPILINLFAANAATTATLTLNNSEYNKTPKERIIDASTERIQLLAEIKLAKKDLEEYKNDDSKRINAQIKLDNATEKLEDTIKKLNNATVLYLKEQEDEKEERRKNYTEFKSQPKPKTIYEMDKIIELARAKNKRKSQLKNLSENNNQDININQLQDEIKYIDNKMTSLLNKKKK